MDINENTLARIAHLARLNVAQNSSGQMLQDLNEMIHWVEKLHEVDTEGIEPLTNLSHEVNVWREDEVKIDIDHDQALKNAPDKDKDFFKVPKFLK